MPALLNFLFHKNINRMLSHLPPALNLWVLLIHTTQGVKRKRNTPVSSRDAAGYLRMLRSHYVYENGVLEDEEYDRVRDLIASYVSRSRSRPRQCLSRDETKYEENVPTQRDFCTQRMTKPRAKTQVDENRPLVFRHPKADAEKDKSGKNKSNQNQPKA